MLFNSIQFLIFFVVVTTLYFVLPFRWRWLLLLMASCYFYMAFVPVYILILLFTIIVDYIAGLCIEKSNGTRKKLFLIYSLIANIGVLAVFKYYNFINEHISILTHTLGFNNHLPYLNILLPIGLSFHTFQAMSYTIEVYHGHQKAERHFGIYALYVMFYPQLVAGPIERPQNILHQFHIEKKFDYDLMVSGLKLMLLGFIKKLVIADRLSIYVQSIFSHPGTSNGSSVVIASFFFAIQIYCDFSGYSDIAIGCARCMGYRLMTNFKRPYFSRSIKEFWGRWHISLSTWFRDYLYIPLGGNKVRISRQCINLMTVFMISGLWHGANITYIVWGALHGVYRCVGLTTQKFRKKMIADLKWGHSKLLAFAEIVLTLLLVTFAWIFFRANSVGDAWIFLKSLSSFGALPYLGDGINTLGHCVFGILLLFAVEYKMEYMPDRFNLLAHRLAPVRWATIACAILVIILFGVFNGGQFIYFQF